MSEDETNKLSSVTIEEVIIDKNDENTLHCTDNSIEVSVEECFTYSNEASISRENKPLIKDTIIQSNEDVFTNMYKTLYWGDNNSSNNTYCGSSGKSSSLVYNKEYIQHMKRFIVNNSCNTIVDIGCGDWQHSEKLYDGLNVNYFGYDVYKELIDNLQIKYPQHNFIHMDALKNKDKLMKGDLCIIKDLFDYIKNDDISELLDHIIKTKSYRFIVLSHCFHNKPSISCVSDISCNGEYRQITCKHEVIKKYNPIVLFRFKSKETLLLHVK